MPRQIHVIEARLIASCDSLPTKDPAMQQHTPNPGQEPSPDAIPGQIPHPARDPVPDQPVDPVPSQPTDPTIPPIRDPNSLCRPASPRP